ncbi:hypothetical protein GGR57DRAFT_506760 [Xylariaceae sp. FL1272]|nr:hypothetical protein GGR57DRAFT_506760 [Xylariaceae sp. FL1272]
MRNSYRQTPEFSWYIAGDANGDRCDGLPPHTPDDNDRITLAAGEVFCRVATDNGTSLCKTRHKFSSRSALAKHIIEVHDINVNERRAGALSKPDSQAAARFYQHMYQLAHNQAVEVETPRKAKAARNGN